MSHACRAKSRSWITGWKAQILPNFKVVLWKNTQKHAHGTSCSEQFRLSAFYGYLKEHAHHSAKHINNYIKIIFIFFISVISYHVTPLLQVGFWWFKRSRRRCLSANVKKPIAHTSQRMQVTAQPKRCRFRICASTAFSNRWTLDG